MKGPCASCWNRREVKLGDDGRLYCEECRPGLFGKTDIRKLFGWM